MTTKMVTSLKANDQEKFAAFKAKRQAQKEADQAALALKFPLLFGLKVDKPYKVDKVEIKHKPILTTSTHATLRTYLSVMKSAGPIAANQVCDFVLFSCLKWVWNASELVEFNLYS